MRSSTDGLCFMPFIPCSLCFLPFAKCKPSSHFEDSFSTFSFIRPLAVLPKKKEIEFKERIFMHFAPFSGAYILGILHEYSFFFFSIGSRKKHTVAEKIQNGPDHLRASSA